MSIYLEFRGENASSGWQLSNNCISGLASLEAKGFGNPLRTLGLRTNIEMGVESVSARSALLEAIDEVLDAAKAVPNGFQIWSRSMPKDPNSYNVSTGKSGFLIEGKLYVIMCYYEKWEIYVMPTSKELEARRLGLASRPSGIFHYEPKEIMTENYGLIRVESKQGKPEVGKLISAIAKFVRSSTDDKFWIVCR